MDFKVLFSQLVSLYSKLTSPQKMVIGGAIAAGSTVTVEVGTNATASGTGAHQIVNHASEGSYELGLGGTMTDSGYTRIAIVETVTVTGSVETYLSFSVTGVGAAQTVNGDTTQTFST
ncbi:MAG: hypothetical protein DSZ03_07970, partial [Sulfurimonas sp.]